MNEKPRMIQVPNDLVTMMCNDLSAPWPEKIGEKFYADADQFRAWRAARNADTVEPLR